MLFFTSGKLTPPALACKPFGVMDHGRIAASGSHAALAAASGLYSRLAALQSTVPTP